MKRRIIHVTLDAKEALAFLERAREVGHTNVKQHNEKIRAESTWRWGWVTVADEPTKETDR